MGGPSYPKASQQELGLQQSQADALRQYQGDIQASLDRQNLFTPLYDKAIGLTPQYDENGQVIGYQNGSPTPEQQAEQTQLSGLNNIIGNQQGQQSFINSLLGFQGQNGNYSTDPNSPNATLQEQGGLNRNLETYALINNLGLRGNTDENGNFSGYSLDPNSVPGRTQDAQLQQLGLTQGAQGATLSQLGFTQTQDANGNPSLSYAPNSFAQSFGGQQDRLSGLQGQLFQRVQDAMSGKLPVSSAVQQQWDRQEQELRNNLQSSLGTDYAASSPGIQALAQFNRDRAAAYDTANRGDISQAGGLGLQTTGALQNALGQGAGYQQYTLAQLAGITNPVFGAAGQVNQGNLQSLAALGHVTDPTTGSAQAYQGANLNTLQGLFGNNSSNLNSLNSLTPYGQQGTSSARLSSLYNAASAPYSGISQFGNLGQLYGQDWQGLSQGRAQDFAGNTAAYQNGLLNRFVTQPTANFFNNFASSFGKGLGGASGGGGGFA